MFNRYFEDLQLLLHKQIKAIDNGLFVSDYQAHYTLYIDHIVHLYIWQTTVLKTVKTEFSGTWQMILMRNFW